MPHEFPPSIYSGVPSAWTRDKQKPVSMLAVVRFHRKAKALETWFKKQRLDDKGFDSLDTATIYSTDDPAAELASLAEIATNLGPVTVGRITDRSTNPPRGLVIVDGMETE